MQCLISIVSGADGFAAINGETTGGAGGSVVLVADAASFKRALNTREPLTIRISGVLTIGVFVIQGIGDKTIEGVDEKSGWNGNIQFKGCHNFIVRKLSISAPSNGDGMTIQDRSNHFWIDHCTFGNCSDGQLDITHGSDYITISWCKFAYTSDQKTHRFCTLIGHDDANAAEDGGKLHVTMHHNWYDSLADQRMPRVRFGQIHIYNNYYHSVGNSYCIGVNIEAQARIQNNLFEGITNAWVAPQKGKINVSGNVLLDCGGNSATPEDSVFTPPYSFELQTALEAKVSILAGAGNR